MEDSTYPDVLTGADSSKTITNAQVRDSSLVLATSMATIATSDISYYFAPVSIAALYGGSLPKKFGVFVVHNTAVNLNSTGSNQAIYVTPVYGTSS